MFQAASISKPVAAMASLKRGPGRPLRARSGHQHDPEIVEAAGAAGFTTGEPVTPRMLMSHTSGTGDGFGFPGYAPGAPLPTIIADPRRPAAVESRAGPRSSVRR